MNARSLTARRGWPRWWRRLLVVLGILILSACRAAPPGPLGDAAAQPTSLDGLPLAAYAGPAEPALPVGVDLAAPLPCPAALAAGSAGGCACCRGPFPFSCEGDSGTWKPPGIAGLWPRDEYLCDGGDDGLRAEVDLQGAVVGLEAEDTVAHFDTLSGEVRVKPSNCVCIYAPRFAAVRAVTSLSLDEQVWAVQGVEEPDRPAMLDEQQLAHSALTQVPPQAAVVPDRPGAYHAPQQDRAVSRWQKPLGTQEALIPLENEAVIRLAGYHARQRAALAEAIEAAIPWSHDQAVQVIIDDTPAVALTGDRKAQATFGIDEPPHLPCLRIIKTASTCDALPGERVDFLLRFDNVGNEPVGNVTIVDHLTPRLEYVEGSQQASVAVSFTTQPSPHGALVLRWEVIDPLKPAQGGLIKFSCRVR